MPRPQFTLKTLLWLTLVAASFFSGMAAQEQLAKLRFEKRQQAQLLDQQHWRLSVSARLRANVKHNTELMESQHDQRTAR